MIDHNALQHKLSTLLTMASEVDPGTESNGLFWCHGPGLDPECPGEPPFVTMICVPTLYRSIAAHPDLMAALIELSANPGAGRS